MNEEKKGLLAFYNLTLGNNYVFFFLIFKVFSWVNSMKRHL